MLVYQSIGISTDTGRAYSYYPQQFSKVLIQYTLYAVTTHLLKLVKDLGYLKVEDYRCFEFGRAATSLP